MEKKKNKEIKNESDYSASTKAGNGIEIAIYARSAGGNEQQIEEQISNCKDFIKSIGYDPDKAVIYVDNGFTGYSVDRSAFLKMMKDADEGKFQILVINDIPRLARDYHLCDDTLNILGEKHIATYIAKWGISAREFFPFNHCLINKFMSILYNGGRE